MLPTNVYSFILIFGIVVMSAVLGYTAYELAWPTLTGIFSVFAAAVTSAYGLGTYVNKATTTSK